MSSTHRHLFSAISTNNLNDVKKLVNNSETANIKERTGTHKTLLTYACENGCIEIVDYLLLMGADPTVSDRYQTTPLHFASNFRKEDIAMAMVTMLLPFIKDVNVQDNEGYTPLYNALINRNYIGIADMLLEKDNININVQDNYGNTLLHIACQMRKLDNVRFLLSNSAIPTIRNRNGMTPIQLTSDETIQKIMQNAISARDITRQSKMRKSNLNKNLKSSMFTGKKRHGGNKRKTKRSRTQP